MAIEINQLDELTIIVVRASLCSSTFQMSDWLVSRAARTHTSRYAFARVCVAMRNDARQIDLNELCHFIVIRFRCFLFGTGQIRILCQIGQTAFLISYSFCLRAVFSVASVALFMILHPKVSQSTVTMTDIHFVSVRHS